LVLLESFVSNVTAHELFPNDWQRLRDIRLASLVESPEAFGADYEVLSKFGEQQWREIFASLSYLVANLDEKDIAVMSIENLEGDFGATCWIGGCWTDPEHRGVGALRAMFDYLDHHAGSRDWSKQGLGVWIDNYSAIAAYEKLGFVAMGEPQESTRKPGKFYQRMIRG
jgi:GNAT superfamily N-acetyltransferase